MTLRNESTVVDGWMAYCVRVGCGYPICQRGIEILFERDEVGELSQMEYYLALGFDALCRAAKEST
jgi:hypothetical protein